MKMTITEITGWWEDTAAEMGDASHEGDGDVMRLKLEEYERKVEGNEWPGLPFTCEAEDEDEAIEKYNAEHCDSDYYKAESAEFAERDENWSFLVELKAFPGEAPETVGVVSVDLSEEDDRGDVEPARDTHTGELFCTLGKVDRDGDEVRVIARVWQDREDDSFNGKFHMFRPVALADFVRRLLDANREFDGFTDDDITSLKEVYGV